ncbi:SelB C-terminal domain-containing protein [Ornithinimicrobium pratense]|uniref:Translation elongation factor n=1 Tax=Ornithinimicrobium pratense TaxID=2593973 RepID=A0A5J6V9N7_9MICO|nr:SelB C-terminal domain-containing protein [Ornithinimicrobium pratense]QFG69873.1 translation elongation factor [Ornithinimicrobium pratense]
MKRVLATAGHVDHGKSTLVRALTGREPDRLAEERARGLTIELGFAWTRLPSGADIAFVDVPGHRRFIGTTLAGLGPASAVVFVVAADQGWQAQSSEHLAALRALGIQEGVLVLTRSDLAEGHRVEQVRAEALARLAAAGLQVPSVVVSARSGAGMDELRQALDVLVARMPHPDPDAPVRLWCDRSFTIQGSGTVVTGTLGAGTLRVGDHLGLVSAAGVREAVVRGLQSEDVAHESVGPVSRVAVNLRRVQAGEAGREAVLVTPGAFVLARVVDVRLEPVTNGEEPTAVSGDDPSETPPARVTLHVGSADQPARARPLGDRHARLSIDQVLPWRVGDRALLRDPGTRRLWSVQVVDVDPLPLRRRGAARRRAEALEGAASASLADVRLRSRQAEHPDVLEQLGLGEPSDAVLVGGWWVDPVALQAWSQGVREGVREHHAAHPLSPGLTVAEVAHLLELPDHLRAAAAGGALPAGLPAPAAELVRHVVAAAGLRTTGGRVHAPDHGGLGRAETAVAALEARLRSAPFAAPEREELSRLGLGPTELAAAARQGRLLRLPDDIVLLPDGPARAMRELAALEQPFTLSQARQALGTTRRVAVPLLEHLDGRGWTRRVDGQRRQVVR